MVMRISLSASSVLMFSFSKMTAMPNSAGLDVIQAVHRISGEAGDGFGQDDVDLLLLAQPDHLQEFRAASEPMSL